MKANILKQNWTKTSTNLRTTPKVVDKLMWSPPQKTNTKSHPKNNSRVHPGRLTWNLQITHLERKMIFQTSMIMFDVNLPGCINSSRMLPFQQNGCAVAILENPLWSEKKIHYRNSIGLLLYSGTFFGGCGSYVFCKQKEYKYSCLFSFYHFKTWNLAIFHRAKEQMGNWKWIISSKFEDE